MVKSSTIRFFGDRENRPERLFKQMKTSLRSKIPPGSAGNMLVQKKTLDMENILCKI